MVALALVFLMGSFIVLMVRWDSPMFRASSRPFLLFFHLMFAIMAGGALLYAAEPSVGSSTGRTICFARPWLTALPLVGVLAALISKTWRIKKLITDAAIGMKPNVGDNIMARNVTLVCLIEIVCLIIFTTLNMSQPKYMHAEPGLVGYELVTGCTNETGFRPMGVYPDGVYWCTRTRRRLDSRSIRAMSRRHSTSHSISLFCCIFIAAVGGGVTAVTFFLADYADLCVLFQGLGQAAFAGICGIILLGPKVNNHSKQDVALHGSR